MAVVHISTTSNKLSDVPVIKGQIIYVHGEGDITGGHMYWDYSESDRVMLTDISIFPTENSRPTNPIGRFYFFEDTKSLYYYNANSWNLIGKDLEARVTNLEYVTSWHEINEGE